jgi:anti-sigma factor RsiW
MVTRNSAQRPTPRRTDITCQQVTGLIVDYVTGELATETTLAFKAHLRKCPDCIAFLSTYQKTIQATRFLAYRSIPPEMRTRLRQFLRSRIQGYPGGG